MIITRIVSGAAGIMLLSAAIASSTMADTVSDFYTGKQVTIVVTAGPRGGHTQFSQLLAPYFRKYLPSHLNFVTQNMSGAGGTKAANYLYNSAAQDGSAIGILLSDTPFASRCGLPGSNTNPNGFTIWAVPRIFRAPSLCLKAPV